jgi:hypothetical protein
MKKFQLWVWHRDQPAESPRDWELHASYSEEELDQLFIRKVTLEEEGDRTLVTKIVDLKLQLTDLAYTEGNSRS